MDKTTLGLTPDSQAALQNVMGQGVFHEQRDAALFAAATMIRLRRQVEMPSGTDTKWNRGSFEPEVPLLLQGLFPAHREEPFRLLEGLINEGLLCLDELLKDQGPTALKQVLRGDLTSLDQPSDGR